MSGAGATAAHADSHGSVTAIIPTLADRAREQSLLRAIASLEAAAVGTPLSILVVVNGSRRDPAVLASVKSLGVEVVSIPEASLPAALLAGRREVDTAYFCFLDDDDEYLPGAIDARVDALRRQADAALVITNGYGCTDGVDEPWLNHIGEVERDPLLALFQENWLPSCGALFRSSAVGVDLFEEPQPYREWTWLAFRIALAGKRVAVLDRPTFRVHDSAASLSKSTAYAMRTDLYRRMLCEPVPAEVRSLLRKRLAKALGMESVTRLREGNLRAAWQSHVEALALPGGWRYGSQTLRLTKASLNRLVASVLIRR
ncbi:MAG TPA: glycosyltransferase family 2 protein [Casimicrobiaceae bacterium]|jgi:glycosyltransferase involved in cell wall biosynthesis